MTRTEFFDKLANGALWDVGVSINRTNPLPLDKFSVFKDKTAAENYAKTNVVAYPGQVVTVLTEEAVTAYMIKSTGTNAVLVELSQASATGDVIKDLNALTERVAALETKDTELTDLINTNKTAIETIKGADTGSSMREVAADEAAKIKIPEYSITKDATSSDYTAVYHLTKDGANTGVAINIPKDKVVKSGTVERYTTGNLPTGVTEAGTYIVLVFENVADPCYINVKDLVDVFTGGKDSKGSGENVYSTIQVNVDDKNVITATLLDGAVHTAELADRAVTGTKIGLKVVATENIANDAITATQIASGAVSTDKIADNAVTADKINDGEIGTAKLADGAVTDAKLHQGVKDSLAKANSAVQSVALESGTKNGTVKLTVDGTATDNIAVTGLGTAAYEAKGAFDAAGAAAAVLGDSTTDTAESNTVHGVKKKAEANATAITELQNGKVNKITMGPAQKQLIYGTKKATEDGNFVDNWLIAATGKFPGIVTVPMYDDNSRITVGNPKVDSDAANKKYVDDTVNTAVSSGITVKTTGTGKYITNVTKTNGEISVTKGTPTVDLSELTDTTNILDSKANAADLDQAKTDLTGTINQVKTDLTTEIGKKQDALSFEGEPSKTNKVVTKSAMDSAISTATAGLTGAMHYVGESTTLPTSESGATVTGVTTFAKGDVVTYQRKEFVYDGTSWRELGDESSYAIKGSIKNADIAADAAIAQSKIDGLTTVLSSKIEGMTLEGEHPLFTQEFDVVDRKIKMPYAQGDKFGVVKVVDNPSDVINAIEMSPLGNLLVNNVTTDIIKNGTKTLILNGGGAAL